MGAMMSKPKQVKRNTANRTMMLNIPWECRHYPDRSELVADFEASGEKQILALVPAKEGLDAKVLAELISTLVNHRQKTQAALQTAMNALRLVLAEGLTFSSEQSVEEALSEIGGIEDRPPIRRSRAMK